MNEVIHQGEATAARRRMYFRLIDATDNVSGKSVTVTGVKAQLSLNGAAAVASTNDIVQVDASNQLGEYYVELTATEAGTLGTVTSIVKPTGCLAGRGQATILGYDPYAAVDKTGFSLTSAYDLAKTAAQASDIPSAATVAAAAAAAVQTSATTTPLPANVKKVNDVTVNGAGVVSNPWKP